MNATYTKLKSGAWGIRVEGTVRDGAVVPVRKKSGEVKNETVVKVLWTGNGISLCAISQMIAAASSSRSSRKYGGNVCAECGRGGPLVSDLEDGLMKHRRCCDIEP